jgi:hypothetical protein
VNRLDVPNAMAEPVGVTEMEVKGRGVETDDVPPPHAVSNPANMIISNGLLKMFLMGIPSSLM